MGTSPLQSFDRRYREARGDGAHERLRRAGAPVPMGGPGARLEREGGAPGGFFPGLS